MRRKETLTCADCGTSQTAVITSPKFRGWRVVLDYAGQYPPKGYRCPACHKARQKAGRV